MKSIAMWGLIAANVVLLALFVNRSIKPNAAIAQNARPGDYVVIPADFQGTLAGYVIVLDNASGQMTAITTDENARRILAVPRINIADLFDAAAGRRPIPSR